METYVCLESQGMFACRHQGVTQLINYLYNQSFLDIFINTTLQQPISMKIFFVGCGLVGVGSTAVGGGGTAFIQMDLDPEGNPAILSKSIHEM